MNTKADQSWCDVRSIPASPPTRGWNRTSIPWMPSMMPLSPISEAKRTPAGRWFDPSMTMAASPVAIPIALPCSGCWRMFEREDRRHRRLQGRPPDPLVGRLRQAGRTVRSAQRVLRLGDATVQHDDLDGAADPQRAAVVCPVRAGGHLRAHPGQDRRLQAQGPLGRRHGALGLRHQGPEDHRQ